ncbi:DNA-binding transcriptional regulator, LysR family [Variovorax sp. HW608]|uniref:LysR family transcriptional regulator n=1 Tax=Variovorax sp. HW608 TaxID=1034889 RepID=UPI00081FFDC4|nr:LysR family transcriptional regulator [Variovorax sp. HW608]SCK25096.1 DNA-binding transcriptional regulator, LysR family [Variovorax sp. HW608]
MRLNRLDLNLLVALDVLLDEKNITRAAQRLNLSQPAASGVLARLRDYFGDPLLMQVGRAMRLTPKAEELKAPVRDVLLTIRSTIAVPPGFDAATSRRHFRIIASDYPISVLLAEAARRMGDEAPGVTLEIVMPWDEVQDAIVRGEVDMLIMPRQYLAPGHPSEALYTESYSCVVWAGNTQVGDSLTLEQYMSLSHVTTMFGSRRQPSLEEWFLKSSALARRIEVTTSNFNTLPLFVLGTHRVATMHTRLAQLFARTLPLRIVPLPLDFPTMVWCMQWPRHLSADPAHQWFRGVLMAAATAADAGASVPDRLWGELASDKA